MRSPLDRAGSPDPRGEAIYRRMQQETLDDLREEIGADEYQEIISILSTGDIAQLNDKQKRIIERIKRERTGPHH